MPKSEFATGKKGKPDDLKLPRLGNAMPGQDARTRSVPTTDELEYGEDDDDAEAFVMQELEDERLRHAILEASFRQLVRQSEEEGRFIKAEPIARRVGSTVPGLRDTRLPFSYDLPPRPPPAKEKPDVVMRRHRPIQPPLTRRDSRTSPNNSTAQPANCEWLEKQATSDFKQDYTTLRTRLAKKDVEIETLKGKLESANRELKTTLPLEKAEAMRVRNKAYKFQIRQMKGFIHHHVGIDWEGIELSDDEDTTDGKKAKFSYNHKWNPEKSIVQKKAADRRKEEEEEGNVFYADDEYYAFILMAFRILHTLRSTNVSFRRSKSNIATMKRPETLEVTIFRDGFKMKDFDFYRYGKKSANDILETAATGKVPAAMKQKYPTGVAINLIDRHTEMYHEPRSFPGKGRRLGFGDDGVTSTKRKPQTTYAPMHPMAEITVKDGRLVETSRPNEPDEEELLIDVVPVEEETIVTVAEREVQMLRDKARETGLIALEPSHHVLLKIQTEDGLKVLYVRMRQDQTIGDVYHYIDDHRTPPAHKAYRLYSALENKTFDDLSTTIAQCQFKSMVKLYLKTRTAKKHSTGVSKYTKG